jgi:hypothetical protein
MPYKEKEIEKLYYTIGEVSDMLGSMPHIRYRETEFGSLKPKKDSQGKQAFHQRGYRDHQAHSPPGEGKGIHP